MPSITHHPNPFRVTVQHDDAGPARVAQLEHIRAAFVPYILGTNIFEGDDFVPDVLTVIGHEAVYDEAIQALAKRIHEAGIDGRISVPSAAVDDEPDSGLRQVDDAMRARAMEWGEAGYLLGLAVGMCLNPAALKGGA